MLSLTTAALGMQAPLQRAGSNLFMASVNRLEPAMSSSAVATEAVSSWFDSGIRLSPPLTEAKGEVVPTAPTPAPMPEVVLTAPIPAAMPIDEVTEAAPEKVASSLSTRPAYVWNPQGLTVDKLPEQVKPFKDQFVPEFLTGVPTYLDGTMQGDNGFDPWALVALANPTTDSLPGLLWAKDRKARLDAMSPEELKVSVAWMREAELKHARLAMLAAAGWPLAELVGGTRPGIELTHIHGVHIPPTHVHWHIPYACPCSLPGRPAGAAELNQRPRALSLQRPSPRPRCLLARRRRRPIVRREGHQGRSGQEGRGLWRGTAWRLGI